MAASIVCSALLLVIVSGSLKARPAGYAADLPYLNMLFAQSISEYGVYGVKGDPKPAVHEAWWRRAGGVLTHHGKSGPEASFRILSAACSIVLILFMTSWLSRWFPQLPATMWIGSLLLAVSPPAALWILNGSSTSLAALLICAAVCLHIRGLNDDQPLPFASAMCLGLAMCLRVESITVWLALLLHSIVIAIGPHRKDLSLVAVLIRGVSGVVVSAIFLAPLVSWNMRLILVPWPRYFDAPLTLDMFSGSSGEAFSAVISVMTGSIRQAYDMWNNSLYVSGGIEKILGIAGLAYWTFRAEGEKRAPFFTMLIVLLTIPLFHAFIVPFTGWTGGVALYESLTPVWVLAVVAGIAAVYHLVDPALVRILPVFSNQARHTIVFLLIALTPLLNGFFKNVHVINSDKAATEAASQMAMTLKDVIIPGGHTSMLIASDQPGRLAYDWNVSVVDLTAGLDPELLAYLDDTEGFSDYLKSKNVRTMIIWDDQLAELISDAVPSTSMFEATEQSQGFPYVGRL